MFLLATDNLVTDVVMATVDAHAAASSASDWHTSSKFWFEAHAVHLRDRKKQEKCLVVCSTSCLRLVNVYSEYVIMVKCKKWTHAGPKRKEHFWSNACAHKEGACWLPSVITSSATSILNLRF